MKYVGVQFTSYDNPFKPQGKIYYYKTNLEFSNQTAYKIKCGDEEYKNPVIVVEISRKAPDPSIVYKEITEIKPIAYQKRDLPEWILPKDVYFNAEDGGVTCIIWENREKTVVRCSENDIFDFEKGFAMAVITRLYGKGVLNKYIKKFIEGPEDEYFARFVANMYGEDQVCDCYLCENDND